MRSKVDAGWSSVDVPAVYVIGAGTSACLGAPLLNNFRRAAERALDGSFPKETMRMGFTMALSAWDKLGESANVEDLYTLALLRARMGLPGAERLADDVAYMIAKTLDNSMDFGDLMLHRKLVDRVGAGDSIISLNWDPAVDLASIRQRRPPDLGYSKAKLLGSDEGLTGRPVRILKLHGSHNWLYCDECRTLWHTMETDAGFAKWHDWRSRQCGGCKSDRGLQSLILPPSSEKLRDDESKLVVSEIWRSARVVLQTANTVSIVGYSFPRTDVQFRMFLLDALSENENLQHLDLVTEVKYGGARIASEDHFTQMFRGSKHFDKLGFHYQGFERWV